MYRSMGVWFSALLLGVTACSPPDPPPSLPAGALPPGTIDVSINGKSAGRQHGLACTRIASFTSAAAGEGGSSVRAVVNAADELNAVSVQITDIGGFTGSYMANLQGKAQTKLVGTSTFVISGVANGFFAARPADQTTSDFTVKFAC
jgi:lipoprotein LpqH